MALRCWTKMLVVGLNDSNAGRIQARPGQSINSLAFEARHVILFGLDQNCRFALRSSLPKPLPVNHHKLTKHIGVAIVQASEALFDSRLIFLLVSQSQRMRSILPCGCLSRSNNWPAGPNK